MKIGLPLYFLLLSILFSSLVRAQVIWQEDFDSYISDSLLGPQTSEWLEENNTTTSAFVSTAIVFSGVNSLKMEDTVRSGASISTSKVLRSFGDSTSGRYMLKFKVFVPSVGSKGGVHWNIQHTINASNSGTESAMNIFLRPMGNSSGITIAGIEYPISVKYDEWVEVVHIFDLDRDLADFFYDDQWIVTQPFSSLADTTLAGTNRLSGITLSADCGIASCEPLGYFDDFLFQELPESQNDAGVVGIDISSFCLGDTAIIDMTLKNWGVNRIDSVTVNWSVNDLTQTPVLITDSIAPKEQISRAIGQFYFSSQGVNEVKAWTTNPNSVTDTVSFNDTLLKQFGNPPLSGTVTVDPSLTSTSTNFTSLTALVDYLNLYGVCGPVNVTVAAGTYNETIELGNIAGVSSVNRITIDGLDSSLVFVESNFALANALLRFNSTSFVTVKNMTLRSNYSGSTTHFGVHFTNGAHHDSIVDCRVLLLRNNNSLASVVIGASANNLNTTSRGDNANFNTVMNSAIIGGYYGVHFIGGESDYNEGNAFINNVLERQYEHGFYLESQEYLSIEENTVSHIGYIYGRGITLNDGMNFKINANYVLSPLHAIELVRPNRGSKDPDMASEVINNMVISTTGYSLNLYFPNRLNIWHNSIYGGNNVNWPTVILGGTIDSMDFRNNVIYSENTEALRVSVPDSIAFLQFDHNIFYSDGSTLLRINGIDYPDLPSYQSIQNNFNINSLEGNPPFVSNTDLHMVGYLANNVGDNFLPVDVDIDGDTRPFPFSSTVDIGADEFDPPPCVPPSNLRAYNPTTDSVTIVFDGISPLYYWRIAETGQPMNSGLSGAIFTDSTRVGGLMPETEYDLYVKQVCGRGDTSAWTVASTFRTPYGVPFIEDFETFPVYTMRTWPKGWSTERFMAPLWMATNANSMFGFGTGPSVDHTLGTTNGLFTYLRGSSVIAYDDLVSPEIYVSDTLDLIEFSFWYHMYGNTIGSLQVFIDTNGIRDTLFEFIGSQHFSSSDPWKEATIDLTGYAGKIIQFVFRASSNGGNSSAISIDDVNVREIIDNDASVVDVFSPKLPICIGQHQLIVGVKNMGNDTLNTVEVFWEVNGVLDSTTYAGQILPGDTVPVYLGNVNFTATTASNFKVYSSQPNGMPDIMPNNDTLDLSDFSRTALVGGNYTVNSNLPTTGTNFNSFSDFADLVNQRGICGNIVLDVVVGSGPYADQLILERVPGTSDSSKIQINGNGETIVSITNDQEKSAGIVIDNTSYVEIERLNIDAANVLTIYGFGIQFVGNSSYCSYRNARINADSTSTSVVDVPVVLSSNRRGAYGFDGRNITIDSCELVGGYYSVLAPAASLQGSPMLNLKITNNVQRDFNAWGNLLRFHDSLVVEGNDISRANRATIVHDFYGIYLRECSNAKINANLIHNVGAIGGDFPYDAYPIDVSSFMPIVGENYITNNLIYNIDNGGEIFGIYDRGQDGVHYINNTISLDDTTSTSINPCRGFYQSSASSNSSFINNIITIKRGGSGSKHGIYLGSTSTGITIDNNNVFVLPSADYGYFSNDIGNLNMWQQATGYGMNSYELDPQYLDIGNADYTPSEARINSAAISSPFVEKDLYGNSRSPFPDIGAIEFNPPHILDGGLTRIISPIESNDSCYTANENVVVRLINLGGVPIDFTTDSAIINVNVSGATTQSLTTIISDNSLNGGLPLELGNAIEVNLGGINMATNGLYSIRSILAIASDTFPSNDSIYSTILVNAPRGGNISGLDSICSGDSTILVSNNYQGELQWQVWSGVNWQDIVGADREEYATTLDSSADYRTLACGIAPSDTITLNPIHLSTPQVIKNDTIVISCGSVGADSLVLANLVGDQMKWYDSPVDGNVIHLGDTLIYQAQPDSNNRSAIDTFYVAASDVSNRTRRNIAMEATVSASNCVYGPCDALNNLELGVCSFQEVAILTSMPPDTAIGVDWIEWNFPTNRTFDSIVIHHSFSAQNFLNGATVQYWNGVNWVTHNSFSNLPAQQCINRVFIGELTTSRFRLTSFEMTATPFSSNPGFREIEIIEKPICESPRAMVIGEVNCLVGQAELINKNFLSLNIYPNPSKGLFTLNINTEQEENFTLTVIDVKGQEVYQGNLSVNGTYRDELDFTSFAKGVYYIHIQTDNESIVEKLVIQ